MPKRKRTGNYIGCKVKRVQVWNEEKRDKRKKAKLERKKRQQDRARLGEKAPPVQPQKSIDTSRVIDDYIELVKADDPEIKKSNETDEFAPHFKGEVEPKIIITTNWNVSPGAYDFVRDLLQVFPNSYFYKRKQFLIKDMVQRAIEKNFTAIIIVHEDRKKLNSLIHIGLPNGPTAHYKLTNVKLIRDIKGHGRDTRHQPEIILNKFDTKLGYRVGRMLSTLFPLAPDFVGRQVATFHNQRDFIFFRRHRYIVRNKFEKEEKAELQELGPSFTLKLRSLQTGTFDTKTGSYEFVRKNKMDVNRRKFYL